MTGTASNSSQVGGWDAKPPWDPQAPSAPFCPGSACILPTSTVELSVSCRDLEDMDVFSKSDPFCVLYCRDSKQPLGQWIHLARTETIDNNLNPAWQTKFVLEYKFESRQELKLEVYDSDGDSTNLKDHDFIGECECSLGEIVSAQGRGLVRRLQGAGRSANNRKQSISITAEELVDSKEVLTLNLSGTNLDRKDWFGSSDPFVTISKSGEFGDFRVVHRTPVIKNNLNPTWKPFSVPLSSLCNGDKDRVLKFEVADWNWNGSHSHIGECQTTIRELLGDDAKNCFPLINVRRKNIGHTSLFFVSCVWFLLLAAVWVTIPIWEVFLLFCLLGGYFMWTCLPILQPVETPQKYSKVSNSGHLIFNSVLLEQPDTFLDFIHGGTELNFTVAVDFTASNGNPLHPSSLHYNDPTGAPNQYVTAIQAVGDIIQDYDSDKLFPALGFGARVPPTGQVSHEFYLNLSSDPHCAGTHGILAAYHEALNGVQLHGPTNFSPVINHVAKFGAAYQHDPTKYFILLIITDGVICDLDATKLAVIEASRLPLSIIIVGVGTQDFSAMEDLDSDTQLLSCNGRTAERDIVQFVEMKKFLWKGDQGVNKWNKDLLAREVLMEIPGQVVGYMKNRGFKPGPICR